jgi:hypothetical protein
MVGYIYGNIKKKQKDKRIFVLHRFKTNTKHTLNEERI